MHATATPAAPRPLRDARDERRRVCLDLGLVLADEACAGVEQRAEAQPEVALLLHEAQDLVLDALPLVLGLADDLAGALLGLAHDPLRVAAGVGAHHVRLPLRRDE